jgi:hypothetical protein
MHILVFALVEATTEDEALARGRQVFDRLVGIGPGAVAEFDSYQLFCGESAERAARRWGDLPATAPIDSQEGEDLVIRGWKATCDVFKQNIERVREVIEELTIQEIMRDKELARHAFYQVGAYRGPTIFLYDEYAGGIRNRTQLERVLDSDGDQWVVPADVHF